MANPYPQLRTLGAPVVPGATGSNPMAVNFGRPVTVAAPPKWINSLMGAASSVGQAINAPRNAMMGNYQPTIDPRAPGGVDPYSGMIPDAANMAGMLTLGTGAVPAEAGALNMGIQAFHGSPHNFERFDLSKIGTGEGAQAYGHGLYFAGDETVAKGYRDALSSRLDSMSGILPEYFKPGNIVPGYGGGKDKVLQFQPGSTPGDFQVLVQEVDDRGQPVERPRWHSTMPSNAEIQKVLGKQPGHMYAVNINADPSQLLDWDKPLSAQSQPVQDAIKAKIGAESFQRFANKTGGDYVQYGLGNTHATDLMDAGIPGIQYLDAGSRAAGDGTRNYVMFDDNLINVMKKYGIAAPVAGGAVAAGMQQQQPQPVNQLTMPAQQQANPLLGQIGT